MPSDPRKKSSVASYFDDDDDDIKPAVSSSTRRASRQPRAAAGGGVARGAQEERVSEPGLSMFDKHKTADGDWEHDKADRRHAGWEKGHEAAAARTKKKHGKSAKSINKKALRESLKEAKLSLNKKLHACDDFIIQHPSWKGSRIIQEITEHRKKFNESLLEGKKEWFRENNARYVKITAARKEGKPNPYKGIHKERVIFMHGETVKFPELDRLAEEVANFVEEHGVYSPGAAMVSPKPKETVKGQNRYYVYNALRYLAREKYQMIESIHKIIHDKMDSHQGTAQGTEYRAFLDLLKHIKQAKETVDSLEDQIFANKKKKEREHWTLPDDGFLPKQVPSGEHTSRHNAGG